MSIFLGGSILLGNLVWGIPISPGLTSFPSGTTSSADGRLAGVVIRDVLIPFAVTNAADGTVLSGVLQDGVVRSSASGTLIFGPRLRDTVAPGNAWIDRVEIKGYPQMLLDVDYRTDGLGTVAFSRVERSAGTGDTLDFFLDPQLSDTRETRFFSVFTEALEFELNGEMILHGEINGTPFMQKICDVAMPLGFGNPLPPGNGIGPEILANPRSQCYDGSNGCRFTYAANPDADGFADSFTVEAWVYRDDVDRCEAVVGGNIGLGSFGWVFVRPFIFNLVRRSQTLESPSNRKLGPMSRRCIPNSESTFTRTAS